MSYMAIAHLRTSLIERILLYQYSQSGKKSFSCLIYHSCQPQLREHSIPEPLYPLKQSLSKQNCIVRQRQRLVISYLASPTDSLSRLIFVKTNFCKDKKTSISQRLIFANEAFLNFSFFILSNKISRMMKFIASILLICVIPQGHTKLTKNREEHKSSKIQITPETWKRFSSMSEPCRYEVFRLQVITKPFCFP